MLSQARDRSDSCVDAVAVARGLARHDDAQKARALVLRLVALSGGDFDSFALLENEVVILDVEGQFAFEHVEKLARMDMGMADLGGAGGHEFFDHAQLRGLDQVPAVAIGGLRATPFIVLGGLRTDYLRGHV